MHCIAHRERRWKLAQNKRFARQISRSNLDIESRAEVRARDEQLKIRRTAAWIAKEVFTSPLINLRLHC